MAHMIECFQNHVEKTVVELDTECNVVIANLATATPTDFHQAVEYVENHVKLLVLAKLGDQERSRVSQIVSAVQDHRNYLISAVVRTDSKPTTFAFLQ